MVWSVYIVRCDDGSLYCGVATDVRRRVSQHNSGAGAKYTRAHRPVHLVWHQEMPSQRIALQVEAKIKSWSRKKKELLVANRLALPEPEGAA